MFVGMGIDVVDVRNRWRHQATFYSAGSEGPERVSNGRLSESHDGHKHLVHANPIIGNPSCNINPLRLSSLEGTAAEASLHLTYNYLFPLVDTAIAYKHIQICRCRAPDEFASRLKRLLIDLISNDIKPVFDSKHGYPTLFYFFCMVVSNSRKHKSRVKSNVSQGTDGALRYPCICCVPKQQHLTAVRERSWSCIYDAASHGPVRITSLVPT